MKPAKPLLQVTIHRPDWVPSLMALCAGYEMGEWRLGQLVDEVFNWLPSFVLPWSEQQTSLADSAAVRLLRLAAHRVYESDKYKSRGEFGELILHGVLKQEFGTEAAVSKFWFKDAANTTVKGFDVVHVSTPEGGELHLWLGEAKFYGRLEDAVAAAIESLKDHLHKQYLKSEFALVAPKVDTNAPFAGELLDKLDHNTSLDEVFAVLHLPFLVTYDSATVAGHQCHDESYLAAVEAELQAAWDSFGPHAAAIEASVDLIFIPLASKAKLAEELHERLKLWQQI